MRLLLDTHIFLWALFEPERLSEAERRALSHPANDCFVSAASLWEAEIKRRLGKLPIPADFVQKIQQTTLNLLPVTAEHITALAALQMVHRDPFDRMLAAQAAEEKMALVSRDSVFGEIAVVLI